MREEKIKYILLRILEDLHSNKISKKEAIDRLIYNSELIEQVVEKDVSFILSDCFWTIKHLDEEDITNNEIIYFIQCLNNEKEYSLEEKNKLIQLERNNKMKSIVF